MAETYKQMRLPMGMGSSRQFQPVVDVIRGAAAYTRGIGQEYSTRGLAHVVVDPLRGFAQFHAYHANEGKEPSEQTLRSYEALRRETNAQYEHLTRPTEEGGMGITVTVQDEDPYDSPQAMAEDIRKNKQLKVLSTRSTGGHSFLTDEENDRFRAVHDAFGHAGPGRGFSRHGEEAAWRSHVQMYTPEAREAMTSETRGQNSYLNYNNLGREFPDNAVVGMPEWTQSTEKFTGIPEKEEPKRPLTKHQQLKFDI